MRPPVPALLPLAAALLVGCGAPPPAEAPASLRAAWAPFLPPPANAPRWGAPLAAVGRTGRFVTFGGSTRPSGLPTNDAFALSLGDLSWRTVDDLGRPGPRRGHAAAYLPPTDELLVVGGVDASGATSPAASTLAVSLGGWTHVDEPPPGAAGSAAAWLPSLGGAVIFGGRDADGARGDTFVYAPGERQFRRLAPTGALPSPRWDALLVADGDRLLLYGGADPGSDLDDLWAFDGTGWTLLAAHGAPGPRRAAAAAVDGNAHRLLVVGGARGDAVLGDVWALDLTRAGEPSAWTLLASAGAPTPPARAYAGAAWDDVGGRLLVVGGLAAVGEAAAPLADGWALSVATVR